MHGAFTTPPFRPKFSLWLGVLFAALIVLGSAFAADGAKTQFDLPADTVARSIKAFAQQAGVEILISAELGRGVRTQPVKGEFTPREAVDRMLARTGLVARQEEKTGVMTILAAASADARNGSATPAADEQPSAKKKITETMKNPEPKNTLKPVSWAGRLLALAIAPLAYAADAGSAAPPKPEEAVVLSPFVVNSSKDTGYQATSTLAGTRLSTPLKDIGASISIYTKDFLNDVGATSSGDLLVFATGMEAAGPGGNFSGAAQDINTVSVVGNAQRVDPQSTSRARGLAAPNFARDFFPTTIAIDTYNVETTTVSRGPNAILFGVGSPAGVVDATLLRPNLQRHANSVSVRYGNNDSLRNTIDFNRVLIPRKLALRLAALDDHEKFNQRPSFEKKRRIYGAMTFEPYKSTSVRANFESGNTRANRPITVLPFNSLQLWDAAGRRGWDWTFDDDPARNPNAATRNGGLDSTGPLIGFAGIFNVVLASYSNPAARAPDNVFRTSVPNTNATAANAIKNQVFHPQVNRDLAADTIQFLGTFDISEVPARLYWVGDNVLPGQLAGLPPAGIKRQGFTDFSVFDFRNRMLDESSRQGDSFRTFNVALEQRAWQDRIGVELAYDFQRIDRRSKNLFFYDDGSNAIRIDPNITLPTGQPNPNLGRPFANYGSGNWSSSFSKREAKRATGYVKYDFKELTNSWASHLGRHTVTGLYEENAAEAIDYETRLAADGAAARSISPNIRVSARRPATVVYLGPTLVGNNNPLRLQPIQIPELRPGPLPDATYFGRAANATDPGAYVSAPASLVEINVGGSARREVIKSQAAVLQSYWLKDHLITIFGWRRDEAYLVSRSFDFVANPADSNDPGKVHYSFDDFSFARTPPPSAAKETKSYSAVLRWPQRLIKLPAGTDLSGFYNQSANFTPSGGRITAFKEPIASPNGKTKEYGLNFSLFHDKLNLRVNRFETAVQGQSFLPGFFYAATSNAVLQTADFWGVEGNINPHLVAQRQADIALLVSPLPSNYLALYGQAILGTAPNLVAGPRKDLDGLSDTTDFSAKGTEIEIVYNPTRNWRILANVAKQETVQTNTMPFLKRFYALMTPVWNQLRDRPRGNYPAGWRPGDPPPNVEIYGNWLDQNVLVPFATVLATEGSASAEQRKWRANFVTNYSFSRDSIFGSALKGVGIGGAVRWQSKLGIGYPARRNPDRSAFIDIANPYYAPAETNVDAWLSYSRDLWKERVKWKVQLNVRNLIADKDPIAIGVQPWGAYSSVRLAPERRWYITNTFGF